jgi:hypothetical protein
MIQKPKINANDLLTHDEYIPPHIPIAALKPIGISFSRFYTSQGIVAIVF